MRILLVNDDGIHAGGLRELAAGLSKDHTVIVTAPDRERSAVGHGITIRDPLFAREEDLGPDIRAFAVSGTPADCTRLGLDALAQGPVDVVISGINHGENVAQDLVYSGTVSAALEAALQGVPAIAVSAPTNACFRDVVGVFLRIFEQLDIPQDVRQVLNVNIPALSPEEIREVCWVPQGTVRWVEQYERRESPMGQAYYWLSADGIFPPEEEASDISRLRAGCVTLTPLTFDLTDRAGFRDKKFTLSL